MRPGDSGDCAVDLDLAGDDSESAEQLPEATEQRICKVLSACYQLIRFHWFPSTIVVET